MDPFSDRRGEAFLQRVMRLPLFGLPPPAHVSPPLGVSNTAISQDSMQSLSHAANLWASHCAFFFCPDAPRTLHRFLFPEPRKTVPVWRPSMLFTTRAVSALLDTSFSDLPPFSGLPPPGRYLCHAPPPSCFLCKHASCLPAALTSSSTAIQRPSPALVSEPLQPNRPLGKGHQVNQPPTLEKRGDSCNPVLYQWVLYAL